MSDTGADGDDEAAPDDSADSAADEGPPTEAERPSEPDGGPVGDGTTDAGRGESAASGVDRQRVDDLAAELADLEDEVDGVRTRLDEKTVHRDEIRDELKRYVRKRQRRGHATGWGPYLVLLYGTAMTVAAFYYLNDWAAVAAMGVVWLSTLGLYVVMVLVGLGLGAVRKLGGLRDLVGRFR